MDITLKQNHHPTTKKILYFVLAFFVLEGLPFFINLISSFLFDIFLVHDAFRFLINLAKVALPIYILVHEKDTITTHQKIGASLMLLYIIWRFIDLFIFLPTPDIIPILLVASALFLIFQPKAFPNTLRYLLPGIYLALEILISLIFLLLNSGGYYGSEYLDILLFIINVLSFVLYVIPIALISKELFTKKDVVLDSNELVQSNPVHSSKPITDSYDGKVSQNPLTFLTKGMSLELVPQKISGVYDCYELKQIGNDGNHPDRIKIQFLNQEKNIVATSRIIDNKLGSIKVYSPAIVQKGMSPGMSLKKAIEQGMKFKVYTDTANRKSIYGLKSGVKLMLALKLTPAGISRLENAEINSSLMLNDVDYLPESKVRYLIVKSIEF